MIFVGFDIIFGENSRANWCCILLYLKKIKKVYIHIYIIYSDLQLADWIWFGDSENTGKSIDSVLHLFWIYSRKDPCSRANCMIMGMFIAKWGPKAGNVFIHNIYQLFFVCCQVCSALLAGYIRYLHYFAGIIPWPKGIIISVLVVLDVAFRMPPQ